MSSVSDKWIFKLKSNLGDHKYSCINRKCQSQNFKSDSDVSAVNNYNIPSLDYTIYKTII